MVSDISIFANMVRELAKPGQEIIFSLTPARAHLLHMAVGVSGEAGELLDSVKKYVIYNKQLDLVNLIEELGDIEFYLEGIRQVTGITREQTIEANIDKLLTGDKARYKEGQYTDQAAQDRADKVAA